MSDLHCHNCQHEGPFGSSLTGPYCLQCGGLNIWPKTPPPGPRAVPRTGTHPLWKPEPMSDPRFTHYRADGWPLCPQCGEDELYSHVCLRWAGKAENPTMAECLTGEFTCYRCNWASAEKRIAKAAEVLERLIDFALEDVGAEVGAMTPEQVEAELVAEGVDLNAMSTRLRQRLAAIRERRDTVTPADA